MKKAFLLLASILLTFHLPADEVLREQVRVTWFVLPLAAVDAQGRSVTDLKPEEIEVFLAGRKVDAFRLVRLGYAALEAPRPAAPAATVVTFLVFDNILTDSNRLNRAKAMAVEMVKRAGGRQPFVVMSLEYLSGLKYLCGPSLRTEEVLDAIEKKVRPHRGRDITFAPRDVALQSPYPTNEAFLKEAEKDEIKYEKMRKKRQYQETAFNYLDSLRALCLALQTIPHKLVFLFSIGIKNGVVTGEEFHALDEQGEVTDRHLPGFRGLPFIVADLARQINRTGTFLVAMNPEGPGASPADPDSGELMSFQLASDSGGKYLDAAKADMGGKALEISRAFYEVQFADPGSGEKEALRVDIGCLRPGVSIHSPRHASRGREYGELNPMEKEVLALDAVASSYWAKSILEVWRARLPQPGMSGRQAAYVLAFPPQFLRKEVDIFFVQVDKKRNDVKIASRSLVAETEVFSFEVKPLQGYKPAFFIVCGQLHQAVVLQ